jgi:formylglycine-generating enzyme required for sulfatase activity
MLRQTAVGALAAQAMLAALLLASCATVPQVVRSEFANSLGMKFVRVPIAHQARSVLVCVHETRECDWQAYRARPFKGKPDAAAAMVNWNDARDFCDWLTTKERASGTIRSTQRYRLPTDHEWSCAVGIGEREDPHATPEAKRQQIANVWPWGTTWPPPKRAGNYFGSEATNIVEDETIRHFHDHDARIANVMQYAPNALGLCDLGGNVWEWCEDAYRPGTDWRVLRGAAWNCSQPQVLLSSHRTFDPPNYRSDTVGFRIVLE